MCSGDLLPCKHFTLCLTRYFHLLLRATLGFIRGSGDDYRALKNKEEKLAV